jgi:hypothetical protein
MMGIVGICFSDMRFLAFLGHSFGGVSRCEDRPSCLCRIQTQGRRTIPRDCRGIMTACPITASCGTHKWHSYDLRLISMSEVTRTIEGTERREIVCVIAVNTKAAVQFKSASVFQATSYTSVFVSYYGVQTRC